MNSVAIICYFYEPILVMQLG